jgi:hypothetical protein
MRNQLALLDHIYHVDRDQAVTTEGDQCYKTQVSKRTRGWVAYPRLEEKSYAYVPGITALCIDFMITKSGRQTKWAT